MKITGKTQIFIGCLLIGMLVQSVSAKGLDLYMSVKGHDKTEIGTKDAPFSSFETLLNQIAQLRADGNHDPIQVWLSAGIYELEKPLRFTVRHNSVTDGTITFHSPRNDRVILSGGRHITSWKEVEPNHWVAQLPEVKVGNWYFRQLFAGDKRLTRARTPNKGFLTTQGTLSMYKQKGIRVNKDKNPADYWLSRCGFAYQGNDIQYWDDWKSAEILTYHSWECSWQAIQSIDTMKKDVYFTSPCRYPVGQFGQKMRYRIENIREALDEPGEWFLDRSKGELHLLTNEGENPVEMDIYAPRLIHLLEMDGEASQPVANIEFDHIDFQYSDYEMGLYDTAPNWPAEIQQGIPYFPSDIRPGFTGSQAAPTVGASLNFDYAENIRLEECGIRHLGAIGVHIDKGSKGITLNGCEIADLGGGGVYLGFDVRLVEEAGIPQSDAPCHNVVSNCYIHHLGNVHPAAVGIWMAQASDNQITNNEIAYVSYSGTSMGWTWGVEPNYTKNNLVARNYIHHTAQVLGDAAGMYSLGDCSGCVYDGNYIDQIYKGEGVYGVVDAMGFDECSSHIIIKNQGVGRVSGKVARFGRSSSAELQTWNNNNFDMNVERLVFEAPQIPDPACFTVEVKFVPASSFLNLSGWQEQKWLLRKGAADKDGSYGVYMEGKCMSAYMNIGGGKENAYFITSGNVVKDDEENIVVLNYDGEMMRFYFNGKLVGEKSIHKERKIGGYKLEIAPITANSLRNGIVCFSVYAQALTPDNLSDEKLVFNWKAPKFKSSLNIDKVIEEAGPSKKYRKNFITKKK